MGNFNLIPAEYLLRRERRGVLRRAGYLLALVLVLYAIAWVVFTTLATAAQDELSKLQVEQSIGSEEQVKLTNLVAERDLLSNRLDLLQTLRSGLTAQELVLSVESALPADRIWFTDWRLVRAGVVTAEQPNPQPISYFIQADSPTAVDEWRMLTHMSVRGQANDHSALSEFSRKLLALEHVEDVKLQRTALAAPGTTGNRQRLVNFDLKIVIKSDGSDTASGVSGGAS